MPKVGKITVSITKDFEQYELWYSSDNKFFIKGLPEHFKQVVYEEFQPFGFPTEYEIRMELNKAIALYKDRIKTTRKVILYKIVASSLLAMNKMPLHKGSGHSFSGMKKGISKRICTPNGGSEDAEIGITYMLAEEINKGDIKYHRINEDGTLSFEMNLRGHSRASGDWEVMEWTPAREAFFESVYDGMQQLIFRISEFFSGEEKDLIKKIDHAGGKFLLTDKA